VLRGRKDHGNGKSIRPFASLYQLDGRKD